MAWSFYSKEDITPFLSIREGEEKWGENFLYATSIEDLEHSDASFVLLGIEEDLGVLGNHGVRGTAQAWKNALPSLVNLQENQFLKGSDVLLLGAYSPSQDVNEDSQEKKILEARKQVETIDAEVGEIIERIVNAHKIPLVIGGGHNNSFPLIAGTSRALSKAINVINLDPHADYRPLEGRHSGNGFSYAKEGGFLNHYYLLGLHQSYNSREMLDRLLSTPGFEAYFHDHWIQGKGSLISSLASVMERLPDEAYGVELDLDAIEYMPTSAITPSGVTLNEARLYTRTTGSHKRACYLHLPEGKPNGDANDKLLAKATSYLVSDFIKAKNSRK